MSKESVSRPTEEQLDAERASARENVNPSIITMACGCERIMVGCDSPVYLPCADHQPLFFRCFLDAQDKS